MAIYKPETFARFAQSKDISDESLREAIERAARGLVDADLGGGLIKQRVARKGQGRRGGYRVMVAIRSGDFAVFLFGFAKSAKDNIDDRQLSILRHIADAWLAADTAKINLAVELGELIEART